MILVTGAGGWLGSELTKQLLEKGNYVRALNNVETDKLKKLKEEYNDKLDIVIGDICDIECIKNSIKDIDVVFHLAAKVHCVPTNKKEEEEFFNINTNASEQIFNECLIKKVKRVIFFSTVSVYESSNDIININSAKIPNTIYGKSKLEAEKIANKLHKEKGLPITIIEPVTVYGNGDVGNFKKLEDLVNKGICIRFGNGENKKTVIYYKDLIKMVIKIANDENYIGKTVICGTEILTVNQINDILIKKYNKKVLKICIPQWVSIFIKRVCSISTLKKIKRKIMALTQNNEFQIENMLESYTKFEEYELKDEKNEKKNILMISSEYPNVSKSSNIYTDLAEALKNEGYSITVAVTEESKNIKKTQIFNENQIKVLRVRVGNMYNVTFIEKGITFLKSGFLLKMAIARFLKGKKFDLILFMSQPVTIANTVKWAMKRFKCPSYLMMKDIFPQNGVDIGIISKKSLVYFYFKWQERRLYKTATTIGCMSEMNKKYLLKHNKYLKEEKMDIFPNTQKVEKVIKKDYKYKLREKYGIPKDVVLAVYGGNLGKPQGVDFFIEVLDKYKNNTNINFLILARGTEKEKLYKYIDENKIENVYKFDLLPREDYQRILEECDIGLIFLDKRFTIPNFPSKSLSYFNLAIPIMAALDKNNDFKDMLDKTKAGFWSEAGDIVEYEKKLNLLIEDKELRLQIGKNGRICLEKDFSVENSVEIINNYLKKYKKKG